MDDPFPDGMLDDWREFLAEQADLPRGADSYAGLYARPLAFPLQRRREQEAMIRLARTVEPRVVMEVGADKGGGVYTWAKCLPSVKAVLACEVRGCPYGRLFEGAFPDVEFVWLPFSSLSRETVAMATRATKDRSIDVLFLDGDKSRFEEDFDAYAPLVRHGGLILFHDITDEAPGAAFTRVAARGYPSFIIHDTSESEEACARAEPPATAHEAWLRHWKGRSCGVGVIRC